MKSARAILFLLLMLSGVFALGTVLQPRAVKWTQRSPGDGVLKVLLGDSRRLFANHFYVKADISFHRGYYPTIFDQAREQEENENAVAHGGEEEPQDEASGFLGKPTDWLDRFGRHFRPVVHTHADGRDAQEILPWLRISADLDPHLIQTYTTAAYWLERLNKADDAEQFLREGLRANANNPELLYELGHLEQEYRRDFSRAIHLYTLALRRWNEVEQPKKEPDVQLKRKILSGLALAEEQIRDIGNAVEHLKQLKELSPAPEQIQKRIDDLLASTTRRKKNRSPP